ncbi:uncharacterized protein LOC116264429 [Nymphaea colorata]|nr:uncharacterized protein LOC116264429 [Nymphaea colorata]
MRLERPESVAGWPQMELESNEGEKIKIESGQKVEVGRKANPTLFSDDLTISRTQISLELRSPPSGSKNEGRIDEETVVSFHVLGRNPVCVIRGDGGKGGSPSPAPSPAFFRKPESGYLRIGDKISFSVKNPKFFLLKGGVYEGEEMGIAEAVERRKRTTEERKKREGDDDIRDMLNEDEKEASGENNEDLKLESFDASSIDPVKEFGFLVIGHEFDGYKSKLKDIRKWNWYVDDAGDSSEDGEDFEGEVSKRRTAGMRKKKRGDDNDDEDWAGESNDKKELISTLRNGKRPRTRSIGSQDPAKGSTSSGKKKHFEFEKRSEHEDEGDESLGGFIVNDDELEEEEEEKEEEEEEEDYDEDEEEED